MAREEANQAASRSRVPPSGAFLGVRWSPSCSPSPTGRIVGGLAGACLFPCEAYAPLGSLLLQLTLQLFMLLFPVQGCPSNGTPGEATVDLGRAELFGLLIRGIGGQQVCHPKKHRACT